MLFFLTVVPVIEQFPESQSAVLGQSVVLSVRVTGSPTPQLAWYHNNTPVKNSDTVVIASDGSLKITATDHQHGGVYQLVATNTAGKAKEQLTLSVSHSAPPARKPPPPLKPPKWKGGVPIAQFGQLVSQNHTHNNKGFNQQYNVSPLQCASL